MTAWLIRATKQVIDSASPADMEARFGVSFRDGDGKPVSNALAIWRPDLAAVEGQPAKYWSVADYPDDTVTLVDQAARDAIDAAATSAGRDATAAELDLGQSLCGAFALVLLDEMNGHAAALAAMLDAAAQASSLADFKQRMAAITPVAQRSLAQLKVALRGKLED